MTMTFELIRSLILLLFCLLLFFSYLSFPFHFICFKIIGVPFFLFPLLLLLLLFVISLCYHVPLPLFVFLSFFSDSLSFSLPLSMSLWISSSLSFLLSFSISHAHTLFLPHLTLLLIQEVKEEVDEESTVAALERADREDHKRDVHPFDGEGLLGAVEASKLLGE